MKPSRPRRACSAEATAIQYLVMISLRLVRRPMSRRTVRNRQWSAPTVIAVDHLVALGVAIHLHRLRQQADDERDQHRDDDEVVDPAEQRDEIWDQVDRTQKV